MHIRQAVGGLGTLVIAFVLAGGFPARAHEDEPGVARAIAAMQPTQGSQVRGVVSFAKTSGGVRVVVDLQGLAPGKHGFHVHEFGDCSADDASSAGGHFNPGHGSHGAPDAKVRHAGDLGNLEADASGHAALDRVDSTLALDGPGSILGRAVIAHAAEDDLTTQPSGNAGARQACGVIGVAKP